MQNIREEVTNRIIAALEAGTPPWRQGWLTMAAHCNASTGQTYKGINQLILGMAGFSDNRWMTMKQANAMRSDEHPQGLRVRKGEKATMLVRMVEVAKRSGDAPPEDGEVVAEDGKTRLVMKGFHVFNASQIEGMPPAPKPDREIEPNAAVEHIIAGLKTDGMVLLHGGDKAYFSPKLDSITMPEPGAFITSDDYHSTLLHEAAHATGIKKRLDRFGLFGGLGSTEAYAREELRAEIASMMLGASIGIGQSQFHEANHHAYLASWVSALRKDKNEIFKASAAAQHISDWLQAHAVKPEVAATAEVDAAPTVEPEPEAVLPQKPRRRAGMRM